MTEKQPQPVVNTATITGALHSVVVVLGLLGFNEQAKFMTAQTSALVSIGLGVATIAAHVLPALHAASKVTPIARPRAFDGTKLVKETSLAAVVAEPVAFSTISVAPVIEHQPAHAEPDPVVVDSATDPDFGDELATGQG